MSLRGTYNKEKQTGSGSSGGASGGGAGRTAPGGAAPAGMSQTQHDTVQLMQQTMAELQSQLYKHAEEVAKLLEAKGIQGFDAEKIKQTALPFASTSAGGTAGTLDGIWGGNTKKAMDAIKAFAAKIAPGLAFHGGEGGVPYREMDDAALTKIAKENLESFAFLFSKLNLTAPEGLQGKSKGGTAYVLDKIPRELAESQTRNPLSEMNQGPVSVKAGDLSGLNKFLYLVRRLVAGVPCEALDGKTAAFETDLTKLAVDVLQGSIFTFGQEAESQYGYKQKTPEAPQLAAPVVQPLQVSPAASAAKTSPASPAIDKEEQDSDYPCFNQLDWLFNWFTGRADGLYDQLEEAAAERNPHPARGDAITTLDMQAAEWYANQTKALADQWYSVRDSVYKALVEANSPKVTPGALRRAGAPGSGAAGGGAGRGRPGSAGGQTVSGDELKGPLAPEMDLEALNRSGLYPETGYEQKIKLLTLGNKLPYIARDEFMGDWVAHATTMANGKTNTQRIYNYGELVDNLRMHINALFNTWREQTAGKVDARRVLAQQNDENRRWQGALKSARGRASGNNAARAAATFRDNPAEEAAMRDMVRR